MSLLVLIKAEIFVLMAMFLVLVLGAASNFGLLLSLLEEVVPGHAGQQPVRDADGGEGTATFRHILVTPHLYIWRQRR